MYNCCLNFFQSCSALYKQIKSRYNAFQKIAEAKTALDSLFIRLVFCFTAKLSASGPSFAFRS